jgi:hypothetical protein
MALASHQLVVAADFDDATPVENDQAIGVTQGGQAVGNGNRRPSAHQVVERLLDFLLGRRIDGRSGLVEDQDARVDQQRAGDRNPLPFATRQRLAAFADQRVITMRQAQDELVRVRGARRRDDLGA